MSNSVLERIKCHNGALDIGGIRYLLIRPDTIVQFQKAVEMELGLARCAQLMAEGGLLGGSRSSKKYMEGGQQGEELVHYMCETGSGLGWGEFRLVEFDQESKRFSVEVAGSAFAQAYGRSQRPVCHLIRGVFQGLGRWVFDHSTTCVETLCLSKGDKVCRFEISAAEEEADGK